MVAFAPLLAAAGTFLGGATSALGAFRGQSQNDAMQAQSAFNFAQYKKSLLEGPSLEMAGLKKAGLNPFLRYGSGGSALPSTAQGVSHGPFINPFDSLGGGLGQMASSALDMYKGLSEVDNLQAVNEKIGAEVTSIMASIEQTLANTHLTRQQAMIAAQEYQLKFAQTVKTWSENEVVRSTLPINQAQVDKILAEIENTDARTLLTRWQTAVAEVQARLGNAALTKAELESEYYKSFLGESFWLTGKVTGLQ